MNRLMTFWCVPKSGCMIYLYARVCASPSLSFIANFEIVFEAMIRSAYSKLNLLKLVKNDRSSRFKAACDQIHARVNALVRAMVDDQISTDTLYYLLRCSPNIIPIIFLQHNNEQLLSKTRNKVACDHETYGRNNYGHGGKSTVAFTIGQIPTTNE